MGSQTGEKVQTLTGKLRKTKNCPPGQFFFEDLTWLRIGNHTRQIPGSNPAFKAMGPILPALTAARRIPCLLEPKPKSTEET